MLKRTVILAIVISILLALPIGFYSTKYLSPQKYLNSTNGRMVGAGFPLQFSFDCPSGDLAREPTPGFQCRKTSNLNLAMDFLFWWLLSFGVVWLCKKVLRKKT